MNIEQIKTRTVDPLKGSSIVTAEILENGEIEIKEYYEDTDKVSKVTREMMDGDKPSYTIVKEFYESGQILLDDCLVYDTQGALLFRATTSYYPDGKLKQSYYIGSEDKGDGRKQYSLSIKNIPNNFDLSLRWTETPNGEISDPFINIEKISA